MKISPIFILLFFSSIIGFNSQYNFIFSQPVQQEWVARYQRTPATEVMGPFFALDKNGNSYVAGDNPVNDSVNILVVKYNSSGIQQWATLYKYPGFGYFYPYGIALDTFGNPYVTLTYGQTALTQQNILTIKFNSNNGTVAWAKPFTGQGGSSECDDIKVDRANNLYVIGNADSSLLCIKYNLNGDTVWVRKYHPMGDYAYGHACTVDDSLNVIITGERDHCVSFPPPGGCFDTVLTVKYSMNGTLRWAKTYFNPANPPVATGTKITNDQYGNLYIGGATRNTVGAVYLTLKYDMNGFQQWASIYGLNYGDNFLKGIEIDRINNFVFVTGQSAGSNSFTDCATIKYNISNGDSLWVKRYNGLSNSYDGANDIKVDNLGNSYITGSSWNNSNSDVITIKYNLQGDILWQIIYNGPSNGMDGGSELFLDNLNNVYVCGTSQNDYIVIKYSQPNVIKIINTKIPQVFKLYQNFPNPFNPKTIFRFNIPKESYTKLIIYDMIGREVAILVNEKLQPGKYEIEWDAGNYASGVYFYKLITGDFTDTKKMVLVK